MPKPKDHDFKVRVTHQIRVAIEKIAEDSGEAMSVVLRKALLEFVARHGKAGDAVREEPTRYRVRVRKRGIKPPRRPPNVPPDKFSASSPSGLPPAPPAAPTPPGQ